MNAKHALTTLGLVGALALLPSRAAAHCDTMNGPVIPEAKAALEKGDLTPILKWVKAADENAIREAFQKTQAVRKAGGDARELADRYFLETLIRLHRAGEGAPYTGLKDTPVEPIVAMTDKALADKSAADLIGRINAHLAAAIQEKFDRVLAAQKEKDKNVAAGREYVEAYVTYTHYVEAVHAAIVAAGGHHHAEAAGGEPDAAGHQE